VNTAAASCEFINGKPHHNRECATLLLTFAQVPGGQ